MKNNHILFIVEGLNDEPKFIKRMLDKCFSKTKHSIYAYEANLHMMASRLENDYDDFDDDELDIKLFCRSYEKDPVKKAILDKKYTEIFLIFDFEP